MHGPPVMQGLFQRIQNEAVRPKRPTPRSDQKFQPEISQKNENAEIVVGRTARGFDFRPPGGRARPSIIFPTRRPGPVSGVDQPYKSPVWVRW